MADEISEGDRIRDGFDWKPIQSESHESRARKGPPSIEESINNRGQNRSQDSISKNVRPTYSEDGLWMWNGGEWIPAPPSAHPEQYVSRSSQNQVGGMANIPFKQQTKIAKMAQVAGKKTLQSYGYFLLFTVLCVGIGILLGGAEGQEEWFVAMFVAIILAYINVGVKIFIHGDAIKKFRIVREINPLNEELNHGDKGIAMFKTTKYVWSAPFFIFIIVGIFLIFYLKPQTKNRSY